MKSKDRSLLPPKELFTAVHQLLQDGYDAEFTVTGNSMWPLLVHGRDSVTLRKAEVSSLKKGRYCTVADRAWVSTPQNHRLQKRYAANHR